MNTITADKIRAHGPCYDPSRYIDDGWSGTILDVLKDKRVPASDRIWVATKFLDDKTNRLFAVWCAREALKLIQNPDPRSIAACDVAEKYASGLATREDLDAARAAAWDAADAVAGVAWAAVRAASDAAAWAAADAAASDAARATAGAARATARDAQVNHLIEMIEERPK